MHAMPGTPERAESTYGTCFELEVVHAESFIFYSTVLLYLIFVSLYKPISLYPLKCNYVHFKHFQCLTYNLILLKCQIKLPSTFYFLMCISFNDITSCCTTLKINVTLVNANVVVIRQQQLWFSSGHQSTRVNLSKINIHAIANTLRVGLSASSYFPWSTFSLYALVSGLTDSLCIVAPLEKADTEEGPW